MAAVTGLVLGFAAAVDAPVDVGPLLPKPGVGFLVVPVPTGMPLEGTVPLEAGFSGGLPVGLAVPLAVAFAGLDGPIGDEPVAGIVADAAGLAAEFVDAGLGVCACFGDGAAVEGVLAAGTGFVGAGGFNALRTASGVAAGCCATSGVAIDATAKTISQLVRFSFRMTLS